jgi:hypothetical protein
VVAAIAPLVAEPAFGQVLSLRADLARVTAEVKQVQDRAKALQKEKTPPGTDSLSVYLAEKKYFEERGAFEQRSKTLQTEIDYMRTDSAS